MSKPGGYTSSHASEKQTIREHIARLIKAYDVRGIVPEQLDATIANHIGYIFAQKMRAEGAERIVIGHDMRPSSPELSHAFADGVRSAGLTAVFVGLISTDGLYFASGKYDAPGAMFTASHNPAEYNGIKLCRSGAKPVGQDTGLREISDELVTALTSQKTLPTPTGDHVEVNIVDDYAQFIIDQAGVPTHRELTIVIDAGNGMAGLTAPIVFDKLPTIKYIPLYFELDGTFPNHEANPLEPKNLVDLQQKVVETKADLGLAFDGDADRCFFVDQNGKAISPSAITALVARRSLARHPGATILYNLITSHAVPEIVTENGGKALRTRVGHSFIKQTMAETGAIFGGEHSAHYYFGEFYGADSGMLAALHVISELDATEVPASQLASHYDRYSQSGEINSTVTDAAAAMKAVESHFSPAEIDRLDGVTITLDDGAWLNLRASNTEPLLRLNVEAATPERVQEIVETVLKIIRS